jgi:hypothetical protein
MKGSILPRYDLFGLELFDRLGRGDYKDVLTLRAADLYAFRLDPRVIEPEPGIALIAFYYHIPPLKMEKNS